MKSQSQESKPCPRWATCLQLALFLFGFAVVPRVAAQTAPASSQGGVIHGTVKSGNTPLPGVTVTAANTLTGQKVSISTNLNGGFVLRVPSNGRYVVRAEMTAFSPLTKEVVINAANLTAQADMDLILLSRVEQNAQQSQTASNGNGNGNRGFQSLSVMRSAGGDENGGGSTAEQIVPEGMPVPGISANSATESVSFSGNTSNPMATMSSEEMRQRFNEYREQGGGGFGGGGGGRAGFGGPGGGPGGGGPPPVLFLGRGAGRLNFNTPHGSVYYSAGNGALNATPYALPGQATTNPAYMQNRFGASIGGPLTIPKVYKGGTRTFFFANYNGSRSSNPFDQYAIVPTEDERNGNFSATTIRSPGGVQTPVTIINPATGLPFANNTLTQINPAAQALLNFIPLPNATANNRGQNFHFITTTASNSNDFNIRIIENLSKTQGAPGPPLRGRGPRNMLNFGFHYHGSHSDLTNSFPSLGGSTDVRSFDIPVGYVRTFGKVINNLRFDFNRSRTQTLNLFAFRQDVAGNAGINGVSQNPFDFGVPNLSFTHFTSLEDQNPALLRNQTYTISDTLIWNHKKHTLRWGGDFRRIQINTQSSSSPRGSFVFTGINSGYDFADFLLGLPQQASVQFGATPTSINSYHLRGNSWDLFAQEEWRLRGNLTFNFGLRYEYVSPMTEVNNRIANLDLSPGFFDPNVAVPQAVEVLPGGTGPFSGKFPASLVHPDRNNFEPRVGIAWKALPNTVIRAGYGINYNISAYQTIATNLACQPPFSFSQTNIQTATNPILLTNAFNSQNANNTYAINPDYQLGYVQIWNVDVQQQIRPTVILNLDYTGTKGTHLDTLEAPNRMLVTDPAQSGLRNPAVGAFYFENSVADSDANAASIRIRKRLQNGISIGGTYTFSKSLDNAASIGNGVALSSGGGRGGGGSGFEGGGGAGQGGVSQVGSTVVAQNPFDLAAERGLSSFDQRHKFTADYFWDLPFGHDKRWLSGSSPWRAIFGDWQWSGDWTIASGLPFTPRIIGNAGDVSSGTNGTLRPDVVPGQSVTISSPGINQWFNTAAFVVPAAGTFGDARRNSIIGPGSIVFDMAFTKVFPLTEGRLFEFRASASNIFNHPNWSQIDTLVTSPTFGQVVGVGAMRTIQLQARFRF